MSSKTKPSSSERSARLAVSIGCPCGVGPEVAMVAAERVRARVLLVGDVGVLRAAARVVGIETKRLVRVLDPAEAFARASDGRWFVYEPVLPLAASDRRPGKPGRAAGAAQLAWIDAATDLVSSGVADALVTGPVSKEAIARSGSKGARAFRGHTEHLAARLGASEVTMAFWTDRLTTSLVTTHLPIADVPRAIAPSEVERAIVWTARFVNRLGTKGQPLAIASLNPHAGEGGLIGNEEQRAIAPGIERARARLARERLQVKLDGPVAAESAFRLAVNGKYCGVVAMYHDQATIPMKLIGFGEAVNVSLGLPIVRTSVDHGTAYDRAGKGTSDPKGMIEAMTLAQRLVASS